MISHITPYIIDSSDYKQMQAKKYESNSKSYESFIDWNMQCLNELADSQLDWLVKLCNQMKTNQICLMDIDSCAIFKAFAIYYTKDKKLCIVNPQ